GVVCFGRPPPALHQNPPPPPPPRPPPPPPPAPRARPPRVYSRSMLRKPKRPTGTRRFRPAVR
ncbi:hypothetical protein, partial [Nocardia brasiliensis]|uniref:hypothetical protein n=1 Tax=Nocardia brasiliensis TaxID=37326 RepID=UPI0024546E65